jgi:hypothetical protein
VGHVSLTGVLMAKLQPSPLPTACVWHTVPLITMSLGPREGLIRRSSCRRTFTIAKRGLAECCHAPCMHACGSSSHSLASWLAGSLQLPLLYVCAIVLPSTRRPTLLVHTPRALKSLVHVW